MWLILHEIPLWVFVSIETNIGTVVTGPAGDAPVVDAADLLVLVGNGASVQLDHHGVDDDPDCGEQLFLSVVMILLSDPSPIIGSA